MNSAHDDRNAAYRYLISAKTPEAIMHYCKANDITPVFASIINTNDVNTFMADAKPSTDIPENLRNRGYYTIDYVIDILDPKHDNHPRNGHPSYAAHHVLPIIFTISS